MLSDENRVFRLESCHSGLTRPLNLVVINSPRHLQLILASYVKPLTGRFLGGIWRRPPAAVLIGVSGARKECGVSHLGCIASVDTS